MSNKSTPKKDNPGTLQVIRGFSPGPITPKFIKLKPLPKGVHEELVKAQTSSRARHISDRPYGGKIA